MSHNRSAKLANPVTSDKRVAFRRSRCFAPLIAVLIGLMLVTLDGCITHVSNPAATQPATEIDPATTQPIYYLSQPDSAVVRDGANYHKLWSACEDVARGYLFTLDREDYREGVISTMPMASKQLFEFWRHDAGTARDVLQDSLATMRRTLYLQISKDSRGIYSVAPKVLVERETILERQITDVAEYRQLFSGPLAPSMQSVKVAHEVPVKYWTPVGRDRPMEKQIAESIRHALHMAAAK